MRTGASRTRGSSPRIGREHVRGEDQRRAPALTLDGDRLDAVGDGYRSTRGGSGTVSARRFSSAVPSSVAWSMPQRSSRLRGDVREGRPEVDAEPRPDARAARRCASARPPAGYGWRTALQDRQERGAIVRPRGVEVEALGGRQDAVEQLAIHRAAEHLHRAVPSSPSPPFLGLALCPDAPPSRPGRGGRASWSSCRRMVARGALTCAHIADFTRAYPGGALAPFSDRRHALRYAIASISTRPSISRGRRRSFEPDTDRGNTRHRRRSKSAKSATFAKWAVTFTTSSSVHSGLGQDGPHVPDGLVGLPRRYRTRCVRSTGVDRALAGDEHKRSDHDALRVAPGRRGTLRSSKPPVSRCISVRGS